MPRFQVVFRTDKGELSEIHDGPHIAPKFNGVDLVDGATIMRGGCEWTASRDDQDKDGMARFVCTRVPPAVQDAVKPVKPSTAKRATRATIHQAIEAAKGGASTSLAATAFMSLDTALTYALRLLDGHAHAKTTAYVSGDLLYVGPRKFRSS